MSQMERKREKKVTRGAEKPAPEPQPVHGEVEERDPPARSPSRKSNEPVSLAELEPVPPARGRARPRPIPLPATPSATTVRGHDGLVVEPSSMGLEVAEEPAMELLSTAEAMEKVDELAGVEYEDLMDIEKDVLRVAKSTLKKKRFEAEIGFDPYTPMVEKIVGDCLAKYQAQKGYSKDAIINTLKALEEQKWIVTAERRTKEEVLGDEIYQRITAFLEAYPGTHARDDRVQAKLGITRNPFLKHILVLDRFNLVKKYKFGKLWNFFAPSFMEDEKIAELVVIMYNDIVRQLVALLLKNPGSTLVELAKSIIPPVYHGAIQYHLKKLEELGLVVRDGSNRALDKAMLRRYNAVVCDELKIAA
ncbi:MAG: hypothetical protein GYA24_22060 [Candidatus Lokiarchaeota archaeon]|nr:hypothetical protein [Candidatus Lokiarchaeota archaeon]